MTIWTHELRVRRKGFVVWSVCLFLLVLTSMLKYDSFVAGGNASSTLLASFPKTLQAVFGMTGLDLMTVTGYVGIIFVYILVMAGLYGGALGAGVVADEENNHTSEFLYPKPVTRGRVLFEKALAALLYIVGFFGVTLCSLVTSTWKYALNGHDFMVIVLFAVATLLVMLLFAALGAFFGALPATVKKAGAVTALLAVVGYFTASFSKFSDGLNFLGSLSPFGWFDAGSIIQNGSLSLTYVIATLALVACFMFGAYRLFSRRDLSA